MNTAQPFLTLVAGALLACTLTSCVNLRRADEPAHYYRLSAALTKTTPVSTADEELAVGLGAIEIPSYLLDRRIAVCRGPHEIKYLEYDRWAERLDKGIQRAVAANLASVLPSDRVLPSAWRRDEVAAEVYISISTLECDDQGRVIVEAHWRITPPGGETTWQAGHIRVAKEGPAFRVDPGGAVDALSNALAHLSVQIAADLRGISTHTMAWKSDPALSRRGTPSSGLAR
jgi:uncharacterized protein